MSKREFFEQAYDILNKSTPLKSDCGKLCNKACCDVGDEDAGMYLFPGEEEMYSKRPSWLRIERSDFIYGNGKPVLIAICTGKCERNLRPLACRIFPLTPYIGCDNIISIKIDVRAIPVCPLVKPLQAKNLDVDFIYSVEKVFKTLLEDKEIYSYVLSLSRLIDEYENLLLRFKAVPRNK